MSVIEECLSQARLGTPQAHLNLTLYPLLTEEGAEPFYLLLDEALESGCARVTEVSESGSVPELKFVNDCARPVLLLDGEELIGAKQNRILNLTVLAPARTTTIIPVSCVEAGRWSRQSEEFASARRAHFATGRARKAARVSESIRTTGAWRSDQGEVWHDIADKSARMESHSATGAADALYAHHRAALETYHGAFSAVIGQAGAVFAINGRMAGLELFHSPATLAAVLPKLVESYALDAIDAGDGAAEDEAPDTLLTRAATARVETFPGVGDGEALRLSAPGLTGGALTRDARVVHLCLFRLAGESGAGATHRSRVVRSSRRRHGYGGDR